MKAAVLDTSAILACFDSGYSGYSEHKALLAAIASFQGALVASPFIVAEAGYMLENKYGAEAAKRFDEDVALGAYELASWTAVDHATALQVVRSLHDDEYIGIADASNVVLADRYRAIDIVTLDQGHFRKLQPIWGPDYFTPIPYDLSG